jgi:post-segregation antitoxin (ccd killing protein)
MRRLNNIEPKNRIRVDVRIESELVEVMKSHALNPSNLANIGIEKQLISLGYMPEVAIRADPTLLLDPDIITIIRDRGMNVSSVLNTGARMVLRDKGLLS